MFDRDYFIDEVRDQDGSIIQEGTLLDQAHFNKMGVGITDLSIAGAINQFAQLHNRFNDEIELHVLELAMDELPWPFNNKPTNVVLNEVRNNTNYSVECEVLEYGGGLLGNIQVTERSREGFKLLHNGSATHVRVAIRIGGGMTDPTIS